MVKYVLFFQSLSVHNSLGKLLVRAARTFPDSKTMLVQCWTNYGTVGIPLALGEHRWANVGPTLCNRHNLQVNEVQYANVGPMLVQ